MGGDGGLEQRGDGQRAGMQCQDKINDVVVFKRME